MFREVGAAGASSVEALVSTGAAASLSPAALLPGLLAQRDDCYLDRIVLLCQQGRYAEAIHAAKIKRFHIYEGGEGNLTK